MKIIFYLKEGHKFEALGCNERDVTRLVSQFNNGHLWYAMKRTTNELTKLYLSTTRTDLAVWLDLGRGDSF